MVGSLEEHGAARGGDVEESIAVRVDQSRLSRGSAPVEVEAGFGNLTTLSGTDDRNAAASGRRDHDVLEPVSIEIGDGRGHRVRDRGHLPIPHESSVADSRGDPQAVGMVRPGDEIEDTVTVHICSDSTLGRTRDDDAFDVRERPVSPPDEDLEAAARVHLRDVRKAVAVEIGDFDTGGISYVTVGLYCGECPVAACDRRLQDGEDRVDDEKIDTAVDVQVRRDERMREVVELGNSCGDFQIAPTSSEHDAASGPGDIEPPVAVQVDHDRFESHGRHDGVESGGEVASATSEADDERGVAIQHEVSVTVSVDVPRGDGVNHIASEGGDLGAKGTIAGTEEYLDGRAPERPRKRHVEMPVTVEIVDSEVERNVLALIVLSVSESLAAEEDERAVSVCEKHRDPRFARMRR